MEKAKEAGENDDRTKDAPSISVDELRSLLNAPAGKVHVGDGILVRCAGAGVVSGPVGDAGLSESGANATHHSASIASTSPRMSGSEHFVVALDGPRHCIEGKATCTTDGAQNL